MREILFKAKRIDNGEWVEGIPIQTHIGLFMCFDENPHYCHQYGYMEIDGIIKVDETTICQYTGLTDKNGRKIWENDIVKHYNVPWEPARFTKGVVYWNGENLRYERSSEYTPEKPVTVNSSCVYEVIGNVFDNSELLEKAR